jgi:hypothetical protein
MSFVGSAPWTSMPGVVAAAAARFLDRRAHPNHQCHCLPGPPGIFQTVLEHPAATDGSLRSLTLAVVSATSLPVQLVRDMRERLQIDCVITGSASPKCLAVFQSAAPRS